MSAEHCRVDIEASTSSASRAASRVESILLAARTGGSTHGGLSNIDGQATLTATVTCRYFRADVKGYGSYALKEIKELGYELTENPEGSNAPKCLMEKK